MKKEVVMFFMIVVFLIYSNVLIYQYRKDPQDFKALYHKAAKCISIKNSHSPWFKEKMKNITNPFWSENNLSVDKDSLSWWMSLQRRNPDDLSESMMNLFNLGVNSQRTRLFEDVSHCVSCALVGNSDNLLEANYGKLIDSHDYVIRFNEAVTKGFEKHVGGRTTHQIMYPESAFANLNENISFVLAPFKPPDLRWLAYALEGRTYSSHWYKTPPAKLNCSIPKIAIIHPSFIKFSYHFLDHKGTYPSTGFIGLVLALHQCDKINLFGYGANSQGKWKHYFGPKDFSGASTEHDGKGEKEIMKKLQEEGLINVFVPVRE